jgi:dolichol-phosphate mannosyltransferase
MQLLSVVIPIKDEEKALPPLFEALDEEFRLLESLSVEFVLVDDGSADDSWNLMLARQKRDSRYHLIRLSRNFGHQAALTAGLEHARGDAVAVMDADLQDPVSVVIEMARLWQQGHDVVYGQRRSRAGEGWFKLNSARLFYWLMRRLSQDPTPENVGDFYLLSRRALERLLAMREHHRYLRGMVFWLGYPRKAVLYTRDPRRAGRTKFNVKRMIFFAFDGILSSSKVPLHIASYLGFFCAFIGALLAVGAIIVRLFNPQAVLGWASIMLTVLFLGGVQLTTIGILGLYVARIYDETKGRPLYIVQEDRCDRGEESKP